MSTSPPIVTPVAVVYPSGDTTGQTDTAVIQGLLNSGNDQVSLAAGRFWLSGTGVTLSNYQQLIGAGPYVTWVNAGSGFTAGSSLVTVSSSGGSVLDLSLGWKFGPFPAITCNGITTSGSTRAVIENVSASFLNGWVIAAGATATTMSDITATNVAGGIWVTSQSYLSNIDMQSVGVGTGANANLDVILVDSTFDVVAVNLNTSISDASTGSSVHVRGNCNDCYFVNADLGTFPQASSETNSVILIEDFGGHSPTDIRFIGGNAVQGLYGVTITGGATHIYFDKFNFTVNYSHGARVTGTGGPVKFADCYWASNGQGAAGTNYDLNWSGTSSGEVRNSELTSPIVAVGTSGVQSSVNVAANQAVAFTSCGFPATGGNQFTGVPSPVRFCTPYNPAGALTVAVPASGAAVAAYGVDRTFYVSGDATNTVSLAVSGGTSLTLTIAVAASNVPVLVPAGATLTPTYTAGHPPTWTVYAN